MGSHRRGKPADAGPEVGVAAADLDAARRREPWLADVDRGGRVLFWSRRRSVVLFAVGLGLAALLVLPIAATLLATPDAVDVAPLVFLGALALASAILALLQVRGIIRPGPAIAFDRGGILLPRVGRVRWEAVAGLEIQSVGGGRSLIVRFDQGGRTRSRRIPIIALGVSADQVRALLDAWRPAGSPGIAFTEVEIEIGD